MIRIELHAIDYAILGVYFAFVIGIGWALKRYIKSGEDFFRSGRALPARVCGLASIPSLARSPMPAMRCMPGRSESISTCCGARC